MKLERRRERGEKRRERREGKREEREKGEEEKDEKRERERKRYCFQMFFNKLKKIKIEIKRI